MKALKKHSISLIFLTIFLLFRVVSVHAMSHISDDKEVPHCEECVLIATTQKGTALDFAPDTEIKVASLIRPKSKIGFTDYKTPYQKILLSDYFHNKPPPSLVRG